MTWDELGCIPSQGTPSPKQKKSSLLSTPTWNLRADVLQCWFLLCWKYSIRLAKYLNCSIVTGWVHRVYLREESAIYGRHVVYFLPSKWEHLSGVWHAFLYSMWKKETKIFGNFQYILVHFLMPRCENFLIVLCIHILPARFSAVFLILYSQTVQFSPPYSSDTLIIWIKCKLWEPIRSKMRKRHYSSRKCFIILNCQF